MRVPTDPDKRAKELADARKVLVVIAEDDPRRIWWESVVEAYEGNESQADPAPKPTRAARATVGVMDVTITPGPDGELGTPDDTVTITTGNK